MNIFTALGVAVVVIIIACVIMNNYFHKKYAAMISQGQADVQAGQQAVTKAITDVKAIIAALPKA